MKRFAVLILSLLITTVLMAAPIYAAPNPPSVQAEAAILIEQSTGTILYQKNMDKRMYPASTTKILTALIAVEEGNLDEIITVGVEALMVPRGSSIAGLTVNDQLSLRELIWGLMLPSGNDAAYTIAVHLGRQRAENPNLSAANAMLVFAEMMNERARAVGAYNSNFTVPDGFHDPQHYSTAYDLALITQEAMKYDFIREVANTARYVPETWVGPHARPWGNTNQLIRNTKFYYEFATGFKTGYTGQAGHCLVATGSKDDMDIISVVLKSNLEGRWQDSATLLEYGFSNFTIHQLVQQNDVIKTVNISKQDRNEPEKIDILAAQGFSDVFAKDELQHIEATLVFSDGLLDTDSKGIQAAPNPDVTVMAPLEQGQIVGEMIFTLGGEEIFRTSLVAASDVAAMPWWRNLLVPGILTLGLGLPLVLVAKTRKKKQRRNRYIVRRF